MNIPAIYGLRRALQFLQETGIENIRAHELGLAEAFIREMDAIPGVRLAGTRDMTKRVAVVSLDFTGHDNAEVSFRLDSEYGISTRCGMHCAPNAHKTLDTYPQGTVRFTFGYRNTMEDVQYAVDAVKKIIQA